MQEIEDVNYFYTKIEAAQVLLENFLKDLLYGLQKILTSFSFKLHNYIFLFFTK